MRTNFMIPVYDIGRHTFDYKGRAISVSEFEDIAVDNINRVGRRVNSYMRYQYGSDVFSYEYNDDYTTVDTTEGEGYYLHDTDTIILTETGKEVTNELIENLLKSEEMCMFMIDINPDKIDNDSEGELKFWMEDSDRVLKDQTTDTRTKIKTLPKAHFCIETERGLVKFGGCKLIEMYKVKKHPYKFVILVEKLSLIKDENKIR